MSEYLFSFYGDDFTGSTDALESLASNGVPTVLFLRPPSEDVLARYPEYRAVGVAGESRSQNPGWMSEHLPAIFTRLSQLRAPICQYKVCSTFDSAPEIGSIGRALEIGQDVFRTSWVPVVVAAPHLRRYVLFGNLFAAGGGTTHRIDRHPTMSVHPVTPMSEADLTLHLAKQTTRRVELLDVLALSGQDAIVRLQSLRANQKAEVVVFDGLDRTTLLNTGRLLWGERPAECSFAIGSSGLIQALVEHWRETGEIPASWRVEAPDSVDRLIVVSGSCSPVTEAQIRWATKNGFVDLAIDPTDFDHTFLVRTALTALDQGQSVVLYTALGSANRQTGEGGEKLGMRLGILLRELLKRSGVRRAVVAGGDTSSHAVRQLGIEALTFARITTPGAPLCRVHAPGEMLDGLELVLKGGQVGPENFFEVVRKGKG